jgi:hypothetical protein
MIQLRDDRIDGGLDVAVVDQIALGRIDLALDNHVESKGMPMQPTTFMIGWKRRQVVRGFEMELLGQADKHAMLSVGRRGREGNGAGGCCCGLEVSGKYLRPAGFYRPMASDYGPATTKLFIQSIVWAQALSGANGTFR